MTANNTATPDVSTGLSPEHLSAIGKAIGDSLAPALAQKGYADDGFRSGQQNWMGVTPYQMGARHTLPAGTPAGGRFSHGPTGVFTLPGVAPDVYSSMIGTLGISDLLPSSSSIETNPLYDIVTGVQDESGSEPTDVCDSAPIAGLIKACTQTSVFGRYSRMTPEVDIGRFGQRVNRGDPSDLFAVNNPIMQGANPLVQGPGPAAAAGLSQAMNSEMSKILFEFAIAWHRLLAREVWTGNPINNPAGDGFKHLTGLDLLIGTGKVDAETNTACPSVDSDIKDFNFLSVDTNGDELVNAVTYMYRFLRSNASRMGLDPVRWVIAMREELFYEVSAVWPCSYLTYRCDFRTQDGTIVQNVDAAAQVAFRDRMRAGQFLTIDGIDVPVVFDDGITELSSADNGNIGAGQYSSDIFFLPLSVLGGRSSLFFEFFDFSNADITAARQFLAPQGSYDVTNGGAYLWHMKPPVNRCIQAQAWVEPRLILRTPFLAGQLSNVVYEPLQHTRQPFPDDAYFVNGGRTDRPAPSFFSEFQA